MRVLVSNVYSYKNKGDAAIVISLVNEIRRALPGADTLIQTADARHDHDKYGAPVTSSLLWILLSSVRDKSFFARLLTLATGLLGLRLYLALQKIGLKPRWLLSAELKTFIESNEAADLVIACGGGYLRTANSGLQNTLLLYVTCLNFLAAKYLGKPVYLYSQSIGPVHGKLQTRVLRRTLNQVDLIQPREDVSLGFLEQLNLTTPIIKTADPALLLGGNGRFPGKVVKLTPGRLHVGITVRKWFKEASDLQFYMESVAKNIDYLIEQHNAEVFYIPQVIAENFGDDDRLIAEKVRGLVRNKDRFTLIDADLHPFEVIGVCGKMDIFIGTRMHSNIFALISHVPVVAIEYEHKTKGIMRGLQLEPLTIDIRDVTPESLQAKIDMLLADRDSYRKRIQDHLPDQINQSRMAIEAIRDTYTQQAARV